MTTQLAAYFYPNKHGTKDTYELHRIEGNGERRILGTVYLNGKREARQQAKTDGATPWNF